MGLCSENSTVRAKCMSCKLSPGKKSSFFTIGKKEAMHAASQILGFVTTTPCIFQFGSFFQPQPSMLQHIFQYGKSYLNGDHFRSQNCKARGKKASD